MRASEIPEALRLAVLGVLGVRAGSCVEEGRKLPTGRRRRYNAKGRPIKVPISGVTLHESVCERIEPADGDAWGGRNPEDILAARGLSVHRTIHRPEDTPRPGEPLEGLAGGAVRVTSHAPLDRRAYHAGKWHNLRDVALEVETRYRPSGGDAAIDRAGPPWDGVTDVIVGRWVWKRKRNKRRVYAVPALAQLEAAWTQIQLLGEELELEPWFPCVDDARGFRWGRSSRHKRREDGRLAVCAHYRWHHADGLVPECYAWLRSLELMPADAYVRTLELASAGKKWTTAGG